MAALAGPLGCLLRRVDRHLLRDTAGLHDMPSQREMPIQIRNVRQARAALSQFQKAFRAD